MELKQYRNLDVDDLIIMNDILEQGVAATFILAKKMALTPPAISHRLSKYRRIFGDDIFYSLHPHSRKKLTLKGKTIFKQCANGLAVLLNQNEKEKIKKIKKIK